MYSDKGMEKYNIIFIHGGEEFLTYEDYLEYLRSYPLERLVGVREKNWRDHLPDDLGESYKMFAPSMPNSKNARYGEWEIWFEKCIPLFAEEGVHLIGHSLGGAFLLKYLSQNHPSFKIRSVHLIAAVVDNQDLEACLRTFKVDLDEMRTSCLQDLKVHIYHSVDDTIVPYSHGERIHETLSASQLYTFDDQGHFIFLEHFTELTRNILAGARL